MKLSKFVKKLRSASLLFRTLYVQSPMVVMSRISTVGQKKLSTIAATIKRRAMTGQIRIVKALFGAKTANVYFWRAFTTQKNWFNVEKRLYHLARESPELTSHFVSLAFRYARDPMVLTGLAYNPFSSSKLAELIKESGLLPGTPVFEKLRQNRDYASVYTCVALLLLNDTDGAEIASGVNSIHISLHDRHFHIMDSFGARPTSPPRDINLRCIQTSGLRKPGRHRLIVAETLADRRAIAQLFKNTDKITILGMDDIFGKADFSEFRDYFDLAALDVEHVRSRITRFSEKYHEIHETTRKAAEQIIAGLVDQKAATEILIKEVQPYLESHLADQLFFQLLKFEAVKLLLEDPQFDHIVIATQNQPANGSFYQFLSGLDAIKTDERVEIVSISRSINVRANFDACLRTLISTQPQPESFRSWELPLERILIDLDRETTELAKSLTDFNEDLRSKILLVTANNDAYNSSTAHFARFLTEKYDTKIAFIGVRANNLLKAFHSHIHNRNTSVESLDIQPIPNQFGKSFSSLRGWLIEYLLDTFEHIEDPDLAHVLRIGRNGIVSNAIINGIVTYSLCHAWFLQLQQKSMLPNLVILTPSRVPAVAAFAGLARRYGIPSIALEPHGLNANYSRYTKTTADYFGVTSSYFKDEDVLGFGIPTERIRVIGTPRIIAPANYSRLTAQLQAREVIQAKRGVSFTKGRTYVTFFCQPSDWEHVGKVWRNILQATEGLNVSILLKTHPEETPTHVSRYLITAADFGARERVHHMTVDPRTVIEAADLLLTGYSTAAIDAAVLQCPVFCVTDGDNEYPLAQHEIIGSPLFRAVGDLRQGIEDLIANSARYESSIDKFLATEPQFFDGPDRYLDALVTEILAKPSADTIRPQSSVPRSLFLDGPHKVYQV